MLKGNNTFPKTDILHNNNKIYEDIQKEPIFREIWSNTFRINPQFDQQTEYMINNFISTHTLMTSHLIKQPTLPTCHHTIN